MTTKYAVGIDIGATNFRMGVVSSEGKILNRHLAEVGRERKPDDVVRLLATHIAAFKKEWPDIRGVGVGFSGIVDEKEGIVYKSPHYPDWVDVKLKELLFDTFGLKVELDNDANLVAIGEGWQGAGKGLENFLMVTLGTGIGGGIICNGKIWRGDRGFAGEIGHILVDFNGPKCECGSHGCWEMYASATGIRQLVRDSGDAQKKKFLAAIKCDPERITPLIMYNMAKEGDIFASVIWKKFGAYLGAGIASLVNASGIMNVVIGGGVSRAWELFITEAKKELGKRTYKKTASMVKLLKATLGDDAGILGGAASILR